MCLQSNDDNDDDDHDDDDVDYDDDDAATAAADDEDDAGEDDITNKMEDDWHSHPPLHFLWTVISACKVVAKLFRTSVTDKRPYSIRE